MRDPYAYEYQKGKPGRQKTKAFADYTIEELHVIIASHTNTLKEAGYKEDVLLSVINKVGECYPNDELKRLRSQAKALENRVDGIRGALRYQELIKRECIYCKMPKKKFHYDERMKPEPF